MTETLEVTVRELDCADEARQIEAALERLNGVAGVRTAVRSRTALITYDPRLVAPEAILASNSSAIPSTDIGRNLKHRERVVGDGRALRDLAIGQLQVTFYEFRPERVSLHAGTDRLDPL